MTVGKKISRKVTVIEVTCLCEENMESWHSININKYLALKNNHRIYWLVCGTFCSGGCCKGVLLYVSFTHCFEKLGFNQANLQ